MTRKMNYCLWTLQVLLALLFLFAGSVKLLLPVAALTQQMALPGWFVRFIGVAEVAGALGLLLPGFLRTRQALTPLAALGLVTIMIGATVLTITRAGAGLSVMPLIVGILAAFVAYNRSEIAIQSRRTPCLAPLQS